MCLTVSMSGSLSFMALVVHRQIVWHCEMTDCFFCLIVRLPQKQSWPLTGWIWFQMLWLPQPTVIEQSARMWIMVGQLSGQFVLLMT